MEENPYKAPRTGGPSIGATFLRRHLGSFLMAFSLIAAALFLLAGVSCFTDAAWLTWQPPWERGKDGEAATIVLVWSLVGLGLSLVTAWTALLNRKIIVAAALTLDAAFLVWTALLL
jgi:hypothetical protein